MTGAEPYTERRRILEELGLEVRRGRVPETAYDGPALWECEHELEALHESYLCGERSGKVKNRGTGYELEREGAIRSRQSKARRRWSKS